MFEDDPNRELIERAEDHILRLREVRSCRIYTDEEGRITEIHVVAETDRVPKLIARDVETCLKASLGISVDYRKIGVVVMEPRKEEAAMREAPPAIPPEAAPPGPLPGEVAVEEPVDLGELAREAAEVRPAAGAAGLEAAEARPAAPEPRLEFLEVDERVRFKSLSVAIEGNRVEVEVKLEKGPLVVTGVGGDIRRGASHIGAAAAAALQAIGDLVDEKVHLCLDGAEEVTIGGRGPDGRAAICVLVSAVRGRDAARYVGCAFVGQDRNEAAVLAVLDALNRPIGRWNIRREIHYRIS